MGEVRSGRLEWSPPHQSDQFWKTNASKMSENKGELVRLLVDIASSSKDVTCLSVAAHDLGQYSKYAASQSKK